MKNLSLSATILIMRETVTWLELKSFSKLTVFEVLTFSSLSMINIFLLNRTWYYLLICSEVHRHMYQLPSYKRYTILLKANNWFQNTCMLIRSKCFSFCVFIGQKSPTTHSLALTQHFTYFFHYDLDHLE